MKGCKEDVETVCPEKGERERERKVRVKTFFFLFQKVEIRSSGKMYSLKLFFLQVVAT